MKPKNEFYYHLAKEYDQTTADRYWEVKTGEWARKEMEKHQENIREIGEIEWNGESGDAIFWSKKLRISKCTFYERLRRHGLTEKTFTQRVYQKKEIWKGQIKTHEEWARELGLTVDGFRRRIEQKGICEETFKPKKA